MASVSWASRRTGSSTPWSLPGESLWQVLPLGPTGYGDSPYACFSSFAGNPLLVSLDSLVEWGMLRKTELDGANRFPRDRVAFGSLIEWKVPLLHHAARRFLEHDASEGREAYEEFRSREAWWLEDYALFMAVKSDARAGAWNESWDRDIALRRPEALERRAAELARQVREEEVIQFFFFSQWDALHQAAARKGISIIGDLPIFAAPDSADVWAHRELFLLDAEGRPTAVSGVPPDYFAATGQLWGNPLYDWDELERQGFRFWIQRIRAACRLFDLVRIDHFRGFESCWSVPGRRSHGGAGTVGESAGSAALRGHAEGAGGPADHRRGFGGHHARGQRAATEIRLSGNENTAVRLRQRGGGPSRCR